MSRIRPKQPRLRPNPESYDQLVVKSCKEMAGNARPAGQRRTWRSIVLTISRATSPIRVFVKNCECANLVCLTPMREAPRKSESKPAKAHLFCGKRERPVPQI